jgi:hypothetical protein
MKWRSNEVKEKKKELTQRALSSDTEGTEIYAREERDQAELERKAAGCADSALRYRSLLPV